ncbi:hypothetical protein HYY27_06625, partial [bacterium]|nr:hypothetical protein [bacterium]
MSRRLLRLITRWVPVAARYFEEWPGRPDCGHYIAADDYHGLVVCTPIAPLALAAPSPEFAPG